MSTPQKLAHSVVGVLIALLLHLSLLGSVPTPTLAAPQVVNVITISHISPNESDSPGRV